jgi:hypothetical protein
VKNQTQALEHASIRQYCKATRLPTVGANFQSLAEQAVKENHSHTRYLEALLSIECEERDRHAIDSRIRDAHLPRLRKPRDRRNVTFVVTCSVCLCDYEVIAGDLSSSLPNIAGSPRLQDVNSPSMVLIGKKSLSGFRGSGTKSYFK